MLQCQKLKILNYLRKVLQQIESTKYLPIMLKTKKLHTLLRELL